MEEYNREFNTCVRGVPGERRRRAGLKSIQKRITVKQLPDLMKHINI